MKLESCNFAKCKKRLTPFWLYLLLFFSCFSCKDSDSTDELFNPNAPVEVTAIIPPTGAVALPLVINGKNFGNDKTKIKVFFDDVQAQVITAKNEHLYILNPRQTGGDHTVKVIVEDKEGILKEKFNYIVTSSVSTVAGSGEYDDIDGDAMEAAFVGPDNIAIDDKDNILASDYRGRRVKLISLNERKVTTLFKEGDYYGLCFSRDYSILYISKESSQVLSNEVDCNANWLNTVIPNTVGMKYGCCATVVDTEGNVYYIGYTGGIAKKNIKTDKITVVGSVPDDLINIKADGSGVDYYAAYNPKDNYIYISTRYEHVIFRFKAGKDTLEKNDFEIYAGILGESGLHNGTRLEATFKSPRGFDFDSRGNMYIADCENNVIRMINPEGIVSTFIGKPEGGHKDGALEEALFHYPHDITISPEDFIYVADAGNYRVRCIAIQ